MKIASFKHSWFLALALLIIPAQSFAALPAPSSPSKTKQVLCWVGGIGVASLAGVVILLVLTRMKCASRLSHKIVATSFGSYGDDLKKED
jgi:hypothetical protein